ncbi:LruC domain-containing protein [Fulvivirgaceae bacterium BMA10]|uniref:LruC domain-containing protein n=1 Tax=Splendidivirga corallicola TaxID=3051826 RepID=A0ABT8KHJ8_9BACT|nr:LruC domain-containing protein [Fulvivirgaceae bacterium BMA10]
MMNWIKLLINKALVVCLLFVTLSCVKDELGKGNNNGGDLDEISVPEEFNFETSGKIDIAIQDDLANGDVKYSIYSFDADTLNDLIVTGAPNSAGLFSTSVTLPTFLEKVYIIRNHGGLFEGVEVPITNNQISYTYNAGSGGRMSRYFNSREGCHELLYAVNNQGGFYTINNESGLYEETVLPNLEGGGSIACAVDRVRRITYYNTGTTLRYYDIDAGTFHVVGSGNPFNGSYPRMEYNEVDGLLYIAKNEKMYIIDPNSNQVLSTISISGIESPVGGGDVAISENGTIYMCTFSGLYRVEVSGEGNSAQAFRISADNLPFQPTSMAIDRNDRLYLATNDGNSQLIEMDKFDGAWQVVKTYDHKINDLGSLPCAEEDLDQSDSDGDGIINQLDAFPEDAGKAFSNFTPSQFGWGSLAFEDLWPSQGDFDFNDLVVNYRFEGIANADNLFVELRGTFTVRAIGASFKNGFGIELPIAPSQIASVTGYRHSKNIVTVDGKGLETGQTNAVIIVFDNAADHLEHTGGLFYNTEAAFDKGAGTEINIVVTFTNPLDPALLGTAPFNPFIFINGERGKELHLSDHAPTDLADQSYFNTAKDTSDPNLSRYYKTSNNVPWAINIIHEFKYPFEKTSIVQGYNHFTTWATSGGTSFSDWYKSNSGYRNTSKLYDR